MKRGITFYIDNDVDMIAFCGTLCTQTKDTEKPIRGVTMLNLSLEDIKKCAEWYISVKGKAEPYQPEIPLSVELQCVLCKIRSEIGQKIEQERFARSVFRGEEKDAVKAEQCTGSIMAYNNVIKLIEKYMAEGSEE